MSSKELPLISIALCTYNGGCYLREQLDSLLAQDYPNLEIVAVDDASDDDSFRMLQRYAAADRRIRVYSNSKNLGFRLNFEKALRLCHGELVAPSDQDDVWLSAKLRRLYETLGDASMSYCDSELVDGKGRSLHRCISDKLLLGDIADPLALAFCNCVSGHAMLFRRSLLEEALPIPPALLHDWWLAFVATSKGTIVYCEEALVLYRQHAATVTDFSGTRRKEAKSTNYRARELENIGERIRSLAGYDHACEIQHLATLVELWEAWERQFVCFRLSTFLLRYRNRLYAFVPNRRLRRVRRALKYFWGLKTKRIIQPRKYGGN